MGKDLEQKILEKLAAQHLATQQELESFLTSERTAVKVACLSLVQRGYLAIVHPLGSTSYAITQKGMRAVRTI